MCADWSHLLKKSLIETFTFSALLNKLNTLKHGNNVKILKTCSLMNYQTRKYLFQEFIYFFIIGVFKPIFLEV